MKTFLFMFIDSEGKELFSCVVKNTSWLWCERDAFELFQEYMKTAGKRYKNYTVDSVFI